MLSTMDHQYIYQVGVDVYVGVAEGIVWYLQSVGIMATVLVVMNNATLTDYH